MAKCEPLFQAETSFPGQMGTGHAVCYCKTHSYRMAMIFGVIEVDNFECPFGTIDRKLDEVLACRS